MAQVVYAGIKDYEARSAARVNDVLSPFETQSTNITKENFRDEGLDTRVLSAAPGTVTTLLTGAKYEGLSESFGNTGYETIAFTSGETMEMAGFTLYTGESARIRFSTEFKVGIVGLDETSPLYFDLTKTIGGVETPCAYCESIFVGANEIFPDFGSTHNNVFLSTPGGCLRDSVTITYLFKGTAGGLVIDKVSAKSKIDAGDYELWTTSLHGVIFWR